MSDQEVEKKYIDLRESGKSILDTEKMLKVLYPDKKEFIEKFGRTTFPQIIHEGNNIGGMKETVKYLVENGHVWTK